MNPASRSTRPGSFGISSGVNPMDISCYHNGFASVRWLQSGFSWSGECTVKRGDIFIRAFQDPPQVLFAGHLFFPHGELLCRRSGFIFLGNIDIVYFFGLISV